MTWFIDIDPGWYFVAKDLDGTYIGEKLDGSSLPKELQGGTGDEHNIAIPPNSNREEYSLTAQHYNHFNTRVVAAQEGITYRYGFCHGDIEVDAFAPRSVDNVIDTVERKGKIKIEKR